MRFAIAPRFPCGRDPEPFLTHEFIDALVHPRRPAVDIHEALAYTVPGIVAHASAEKGGAWAVAQGYDKLSQDQLKAL